MAFPMGWEEPRSPFCRLLKDRIDLYHVPFSERSSRMMVFAEDLRPGVPGLFIRLAERWEKQQEKFGDYRQRRPIVERMVFIGPDGEPLPVSFTAYPHAVFFHTPRGTIGMTFNDPEALYFSLPPESIGFQFVAQAETARADRRGGILRGVRNLAYTTNARLRLNQIESAGPGLFRITFRVEPTPDAAVLLNITPRLGFNRSLRPALPVFQEAEARWHEWFAAAPPVHEALAPQYYYAWWVMRAGLISPRFYMTREGMTPSKIHYVGVWQWDACFHALAYRYVDLKLAEDQIRLVLDHQREDGMIPDAVHDEGRVTHLPLPVDADVTKPPITAWAAWKIYEMGGDRDFLDEIYEPLVRWNRWWFERNDDDRDGLCQYNHPYSSGWDDSPVWDGGMPVESPDLNTYLVIQMEHLARIAEVIGETEDAARRRAEAEALTQRMIAAMWDEEAGLFWPLRREQPVRIKTPLNLYPLLTGRLPRPIVERLVAHLQDPHAFWPRYPIPTVALDDPHYNPEQMWRGPTWLNINRLFIEGLFRCGYPELARELRRRTLRLAMGHRDLYEYYHPETGGRPPRAAPIFGWTSAVFIELAIEASREPDLDL
jgi:putative isomerase